jgi:ribosome-binding factor A
MSSRRRQQVGDLIRDEVSQILTYEMKDPRLGMVSITRVEMSPDLRYATIHASVYGEEEEQSETLHALSGASGYIRRLLAPRLRIRHIPVLSFRLDKSMAHADQIARTLNQIREEEGSEIETVQDTDGSNDRPDGDRED